MKKKTEKIFNTALLIMGFLTLLLVFYGLVSYLIKYYPLEKVLKKYVSEEDKYCKVDLISEDKGIGFIEYDCKSGRILRGIKRCKGEYYIFINKINGKWVVNESSKTIVW